MVGETRVGIRQGIWEGFWLVYFLYERDFSRKVLGFLSVKNYVDFMSVCFKLLLNCRERLFTEG